MPLAQHHHRQGKAAEAETWYRKAIPQHTEKLGPEPQARSTSDSHVAVSVRKGIGLLIEAKTGLSGLLEARGAAEESATLRAEATALSCSLPNTPPPVRRPRSEDIDTWELLDYARSVRCHALSSAPTIEGDRRVQNHQRRKRSRTRQARTTRHRTSQHQTDGLLPRRLLRLQRRALLLRQPHVVLREPPDVPLTVGTATGASERETVPTVADKRAVPTARPHPDAPATSTSLNGTTPPTAARRPEPPTTTAGLDIGTTPGARLPRRDRETATSTRRWAHRHSPQPPHRPGYDRSSMTPSHEVL